ncbi:PREDICTED: helicase domino [Dufourea novaeangliae]|uniref:helicase domino n=1 Tax=Dufourea novaeangliae TaxID=178035 RepID=UPI000767475E|nr:PREDICTED: helicase domino [Dufourea novaeangliae]
MSDKQTAPILPPLNGGGGNNGGGNGGAPQQTVSLQQVLASAQGLNVLTTGGGQQFVITSQVPGLAQVIPSSATTNSNIQQVGVTRLVNISGTPPRASTVGVASASGSPLASPSRQNSPKVVLATSPKLVRTSIGNMFVAPTSQASMQSPPARKKLKLADSTEKPIMCAIDATGYRRRIMEHKMKRMRAIREKYADNASELFFLHAGGNMMDFQTWRKRPPTPQYLHFLRQHRLDPEDDDEDLTVPLPTISEIPLTATVTATVSTIVPVSQCAEVKISGMNVTPVAVSTTLPAAVAQLNQQGHVPGRPQGGRHGMVFAFRAAIQSSPVTVHSPPTSTLAPALIIGSAPLVPGSPKQITTTTATTTTTTTAAAAAVAASPVADKLSTTAATITTTSTTTTATVTVTSTLTPTLTATVTTTIAKTSTAPTISPSQPVVKLVKLPVSNSTTSDITNNQEQIVEKAKQEAYVMQRIAELQREGLWSERRLPKVQEPARTKAHWDYLLEEMVWLAADFAQERKWKKAAAKKCARMVQKYFQEKAIQAQKAEKSQELRLKKIASFIAKEIKTFWTNVEKLVEYKQQTRLEEKRKQALDQHLNFIVGQTEKYSTWLTEGLNKTDGPQSIPASMNSSRISSPIPPGKSHSDEDFQPNQSSDDDEETIAKAEEELKSVTNHKEEVELLKRESEIPLEDLLKDLPPNYLEDRNKNLSPSKEIAQEDNDEKAVDGDTDFVAASDESSDEEETIMEQEKLEENTDYKQELDDLKAENEMSIDELMAKYGNISDVPMDVDQEPGQESDKESTKEEEGQENDEECTSSENESEESSNEVGEQESQTQSDNEADVGLKSLLEDISIEKSTTDKTAEMDHSDAHNEMDNVAALAESIQPKGNTLLTTSVVTKIPFLLKHSLREYQHIGLDWLVTMYDRKLNGILADEMGLGKTIQTIALLAHLACEKGNWGPHLIIVPTSVMLNWEMECKKWCPGFKILTYYGTQKERKQKRTGWTKPNAFHICITSYKLVIQDHQSFRRKKWKYLILDEAQNIKNFKSQRWQLLLNFQTQRRLLLTGTPLQNNLMELWSLMHFLMPNVFQSHREFKEWFSNPVTGMIEGNSEYNENIIRRLHKVLRPFLLRRLKTEVEKQLPKKYEHVVICRLSKRQRYLYDDFMSRAKTKETLASGNLLSVINVLMQLRKVCNHPNLFEVRPTVSPFQMDAIEYVTASLIWSALEYDPFKHIDLSSLNLLLCDLELTHTAFVAHRVRRLQTPRKLIEEIDSQPDPPPRCPPGKIKINVRLSNQAKPPSTPQQTPSKLKNLTGILPTTRVGTSPLIKTLNNQSTTGQGVTLRVSGGQQLQGYSVQLVQHQGSVKAIPVGTLAHNPQSTTVTSTTAATNAQKITVGNANIKDGLQRLTTQTVTVKQGDSVQRIAVPSFAQLVQTSTGRHIILTSNQQNTNTVSFPVMTPGGQRLTVLSKSLMGLSTSAATVNKVVGGVVTTATSGTSGRPVMRVPPLNVTASQTQPSAGNGQSPQQSIRCGIVTRHAQKESEKAQMKERPKSEFYLPQLEEERKQRRQAKLRLIANINERRCAACPLYGEDLFMALRIGKPSTACRWHNGWVHCTNAKDSPRTRRQFFSRTEALAEAIKSTEQIVEELKEVFERFVVHVPAVCAPTPRFHVSHPPPHKLYDQRRMQTELQRQLSPKFALFHPVTSAMMTQFPDPRLIQYDCGKLQSLDRLLRKLKTGNHRVLIFTQMTRMLDVLEAFLNFHGHIYLRLDGTTRVDQRQVLMERFNGDKRIFCFILSTRSGGVGVNLTGADTVIFYDSDWNPTMDAQAQDRCHRIGQTRDVHIYRLVSEKTVEENILKKANQKRLLGDLAIEGGNFTTAYFKSSTIQDLFNIDQTENDASMRMAEVLEQNKDREKFLQKDSQGQGVDDKAAIGALESALAAAEEDLDVQAAKTAKAEAVADLAEFDENIPLDEADKDDVQVSKAELEVQNLVSQLTPIERYAMKFVEESEGAFSAAQLAAAERELEEQKKEWELDRLRALREEEERRMRLADDDEKPLTFGREDAQNQVNNASNSKKLVSKKLPANRRRRSRRNNSKSAQESESESDTTTESESESQEDVVEDSLDEESSHTESQSQGDEDDEEEDETNDQNDSERGGYPKRKNRSNNKSFSQNHFDLNSPRTRSRGNVKINLWTLDVSPILPGIKPKCRGRASNIRKQRELEMRMKAEQSFALPLPPPTSSPKRLNTTNKPDDEQSTINPKGQLPELKLTKVDVKFSASKDSTRTVENYKTIGNHCVVAASSLKTKLKKNTDVTDESDSVVRLDSLDTEACIRVAGSVSSVREERKIMEFITIDTKVDDEEEIQTKCNNTDEESCEEDPENPDVSFVSQNHSSCSTVAESGTLKMMSDSDLSEEINVSENSLSTPLKNKIIIREVDESTAKSVADKTSGSVSKNLVTEITDERSEATESEIVDVSVDAESNERPRSPNNLKEKVNIEQTLPNKEQSSKNLNSDAKDDSINGNVSISVIETSSSQETGNNEQQGTCAESNDEETKFELMQSNDNKPAESYTDILESNETTESDPSLESKLKFRKPGIISHGVTTRRAKINVMVENAESKDTDTRASSTESNIPKQNQESENLSISKKEVAIKVAWIRRPDTPRPVTEQGRITRSSAGRSLTPPPSSSPSKSVQRRQPDTPLADCLKTSPRPVTRSSSNVNSPVRNEEQHASYEKPTTRSSKSLDNGFLNPAQFRRSSSIPPMKSSDMKDVCGHTTKSKKSNESPVVNASIIKRRPDTPVPTFEQVARVTRSGLNFTLNPGKSSPNHVSPLRGNKHVRKTDSSGDTKAQESSPTKAETLSTDSNGNAVASEDLTKQDDSSFTEMNEKPQRTAKVVAILTLDTRSNHTGKTSGSVHPKANCNSTDTKNTNKKGTDSSTSDSPGKNCLLRISDVTTSCKLDGWCSSGLDNASTVLTGVASTYTSGKTGKSSTANKGGSPLSSKLKTDKVPLPMQSAVIALVDLDNDPNYDSADGSKRLRRKMKRTRLTSFSKSLSSGKANESQTVDTLDEEEEEDEQIPPSKKSVRSQHPSPPSSSSPPPASQTAQLGKISSGTVS